MSKRRRQSVCEWVQSKLQRSGNPVLWLLILRSATKAWTQRRLTSNYFLLKVYRPSTHCFSAL